MFNKSILAIAFWPFTKFEEKNKKKLLNLRFKKCAFVDGTL